MVLVTAPDLKTARKLARAALAARLVACANLIPRIESHYWWQGKIESRGRGAAGHEDDRRPAGRAGEVDRGEAPVRHAGVCRAAHQPREQALPGLGAAIRRSDGITACAAARLRQIQARLTRKLMSLEFELQKYPKEIKLKDGSKCKLRPLRKDDEKDFHEFFLAVPEAGAHVHQASGDRTAGHPGLVPEHRPGPQPAAAGLDGWQDRRRRHAPSAAWRLEAAHRPRQRAGAPAIPRARVWRGRW